MPFPISQIPDKTDLLESADRIRGHVHHTPVLSSALINDTVQGELFFKCENFQKAGAFKSRGATNALFSLPDEALVNGVCTHSSGNHAAALSRAAGLRGVTAHIIMPENSSRVKVEAVRQYGGRIHFCKPTLQARESALQEVQESTGAVELHPYNNYTVIAGQATAAMELIEVVPDLDQVMAPVGGGGLLSGTALAACLFAPGARVLAAEPKGADDAYRSFISGRFIPSVDPVTIADGLLTSLGSLTFPIIQKHVDTILTVTEESIVIAMKLIWERMKIIVEPSSAVPMAAVLENPKLFRGTRTGIILSGGNVDLNKLPW